MVAPFKPINRIGLVFGQTASIHDGTSLCIDVLRVFSPSSTLTKPTLLQFVKHYLSNFNLLIEYTAQVGNRNFSSIVIMSNMEQYLEMLERLEVIPEKDVKLICEKAKEIFLAEPNLVPVRAPVTVCGDTHGQFFDLLEIFDICGKLPSTNYLFMGDYVDRGFNSVQTFLYVVLLKIKYRSRITLLRGNHENKEINKQYGFYDECLRKYGTEHIWKIFVDLFHSLPVSAVIENQVFCLHGGLSPEIDSLEQIKEINRLQDIPNNGPMCDLLWSDPAEDGKNGYSSSPRGAGFCWGEDVSDKFTFKNSLKTICRAHQLMIEGYSYTHQKKCVTVFSAPNYCYRCGNQGSALEISESLQYYYHKYDPSPKEKENEPSKRVPDYFL